MPNLLVNDMSNRRKSIKEIAGTLSDRDDISDAVFDLRGFVCQVMKEKNYIPKEDACVEHQPNIDAVIRRLVEWV